jgi:hypothetical protein
MPLDENEAQLLLGSADEDHSGGIDMREFVSIMTTPISEQDLEEELRATFNVFDKDATGVIDADTLKRFVRVSQPAWFVDERDRASTRDLAVGQRIDRRGGERHDRICRSEQHRFDQFRCVRAISSRHVMADESHDCCPVQSPVLESV